MLGRFGRDAGSVLGVQITSGSVRVLRLQGRPGRQRVAGWALEPIDAPAQGEGDGEPLLRALRQAWRRCGGRARQVALALPGSQVICKLGHLPAALPEAEREARLLADAQQLFPFPVEDLALDFQVLGASAQVPDALDVLIGAARHSLLEPWLQVFEEAGLDVVAFEVDSLALRRLQPGESRRPLLLMEPDGVTLYAWTDSPLPWRSGQAVAPGADQEGYLQCIDCLVGGQPPVDLARGLVVGGAGITAGWLRRLERHLGIACERVCIPGNGQGTPADEMGAMTLPLGLALGGGQWTSA